jgi:hypothetical protein
VSPSEGCKLLGWDASGGWTQFSHFGEGEGVSQTARENWQPENWVESLGYAITASALGMDEEQEFGANRGFVHRGNQGNQGEQGNRGEAVFTEERFASFIIDV